MCFKKDSDIKFKVTHSAHEVGFYTYLKDLTPMKYKSNVIYKFKCPGCNVSCNSKTERNLC